jgi:hypothetical protein
MKVKELIEKLKEFDGELEVITYSDYNEYGNGTIEGIRLQDEYDSDTGNETGNYNVSIDFFWDGNI